jgi:hypothetical protein
MATARWLEVRLRNHAQHNQLAVFLEEGFFEGELTWTVAARCRFLKASLLAAELTERCHIASQ